MEPIILKRGQTLEYTFHTDRMVAAKKGKVIFKIDYSWIESLIFNPKMEWGDLLNVFLSPASSSMYSKGSFTIMLKYDYKVKGCREVWLKLSDEEFERVKMIIPMQIEII